MNLHDLTSIPVIDAHVHVFPPKMFQALKSWFDENAWEFMKENTAEGFIQAQFDRGAAGLLLMPYAHRPGMADWLNEFNADLIRRYPHTAGMAAIHPQDENPREILKRAFEELGLCGIKMHCHVKGIAPDDPSMFPIYEAALEHDRVVNMHAGREPALDAYGYDVHTVSGVDRVENALRRYPELKLVIPHLGFDETERFCELLDEYPNLYLDTAMTMSDVFVVDYDREQLIEHADRILYGTDYPHIPHAIETELKTLLALDLGEPALKQILFENASNLFAIEPKS
jgi:hypothetical protein